MFAPGTLNLSLGLTIIGIGMNVWDGLNFSGRAGGGLRTALQTSRLRRRGRELQAAVREIDAILTTRLGPP